jgi:hypothetical protein
MPQRPINQTLELRQLVYLQNGYVILTDYRIIWIPYQYGKVSGYKGVPCHIPLPSVASIEVSRTLLKVKPSKVTLYVRFNTRGHPSLDILDVANVFPVLIIVKGRGVSSWQDAAVQTMHQQPWKAVSNDTLQQLVRVMDKNGTHEIVEQLESMGFGKQEALEATLSTNSSGIEGAVAWLLDRPPSAAISTSSSAENAELLAKSDSYKGGIGGILQREQQRADQTDKTLGEAFHDLRNLMTKAEEMVKLAQYFRDREALFRGTGEQSENNNFTDLALDFESLGIASPVTRETSGRLYFSELSRQLAAIINGPLQEAGGMLPLVEVYRIFCRARLTELVSPEDMLHAARLFSDVQAPLRLREFSTGVKVVELTSELKKEASIIQKIVEMAEAEPDVQPDSRFKGLGRGVTSTEVASALHIPLFVASEHLAAAERGGFLCRDDGPEGVRFFKNFFRTVKL